MSLKTISHFVMWPAFLLVGGTIVFAPRDVLRQPVLPKHEAPLRVAVMVVTEPQPALIPATLTVRATPLPPPPVKVAALVVPEVLTEPEAVSEPEVPEDVFWVKASNLNLRAGPSVEASRIASLPFGTPVAVLDVSETWAMVEADGQLGWLSAKYLTDAEPQVE